MGRKPGRADFIFSAKRLNQRLGLGKRDRDAAARGLRWRPVLIAFSAEVDSGSAQKTRQNRKLDRFRCIGIGHRVIETERDLTDNPQDREKLANEVIDVVAAEGMIDRSKVTPDATIESLDLKSVDIVMILTALEEKFNVYIPMDGTLQEAKDVKSLINAIVDLIIKEREKS